jgi:hypothetical protein
MCELAGKLVREGMTFEFFTLSNESLIQRARNLLAHWALNDPSVTHLLWIDSDIGFRADDVLQMLRRDIDFLCGAYSRKGLEWERVRQAALAGKPNLDECASQTLIEGMNGALDVWTVRDHDLIEVKRGGTGFMLLKRSVFETMARAPWMRSYKNNQTTVGRQPAQRGDTLTAYFECPIENDLLVSEDYFFCDNWRRCGGKIFVAPWIRLSHSGTYRFV